jgi:hypothetical protein
LPNDDERPIVFYSGKDRTIILKKDACAKVAEGRARFDGNEKLHLNTHGLCLLNDGRCQWCGTDNCLPKRAGVVRRVISPRYGAPNGKYMRVKPSQSRRNINLDDGLIRVIDPNTAQIAGELRQINAPGLGVWNPERNQLHNDLRTLELEVSDAKIQGGIEAARAKRAEQKKLFIDWLSRLEKERGRGDYLADRVVNYSKFLFSPHDRALHRFKDLLQELNAISQRNERLRRDGARRRLLKTTPFLTAELRLAVKKAELTLKEVEAIFSISREWLRSVETGEEPITPEHKTHILQLISLLYAWEAELNKMKADSKIVADSISN